MESCSTSSIFNKQTASFSRGHSQKSARNYLWPLCRWKAAFHLQILRFFGLLISCGWSFLGRNATLRPPIRLLIHPSRLVFHPLITPHTNYNTYAMYLSGILHSEESIVGIKLKLVEYQCRKLINNAWHTCLVALNTACYVNPETIWLCQLWLSVQFWLNLLFISKVLLILYHYTSWEGSNPRHLALCVTLKTFKQ